MDRDMSKVNDREFERWLAAELQVILTKAEDNKHEGNDYYKQGEWAVAIAHYTTAIDAITGVVHADLPRFAQMMLLLQVHIQTNNALDMLAILHNNRAACYLQRGQPWQALKDASAVVFYNATFMEEFHRGADHHAYFQATRARPLSIPMLVKARSRRYRAFMALGNSSRALEELCQIAPLKGLDAKHLFSPQITHGLVPPEVISDIDAAVRLDHPDLSLVRTQKLDWSLAVSGRWTEVTTVGQQPPPVWGHVTGLWRNRLYVCSGQIVGSLHEQNSTLYALDLGSMRWRKVLPKPGAWGPSASDLDEVQGAQWQQRIYIYKGSSKMLYYDMESEAWGKLRTRWPSSSRKSVAWAQEGAWFKEFGMVGHEGKLYVFGGSGPCVGPTPSEPLHNEPVMYGTLAAYDIVSNVWEVLFEQSPVVSSAYPEPRYVHSMWSSMGKLFVFGGRIARSLALNDYTLREQHYFWSYCPRTRRWTNEASYLSGANCTNLPAGRSELACAAGTAPGGPAGAAACIFGGYATQLLSALDRKSGIITEIHDYTYLADCFVYDAATRVWRVVYTGDVFPCCRAGASLVYLPGPAQEPTTAGASGGSSPSGGDGASGGGAGGAGSGGGASGAGSGARGRTNSAGRSSKSKAEGRWLLFGGYSRGSASRNLIGCPPDSEPGAVWELQLLSSPKRIHSVCHGCGAFSAGNRPCGGSCGGAIVVCGEECLKKVWATHKAICRRV